MTTAVVSRSTVPLNEEQARMDLAGRRSALETMFTAGYEIFAFVMNKRKAHYGASTAFCIFPYADGSFDILPESLAGNTIPKCIVGINFLFDEKDKNQFRQEAASLADIWLVQYAAFLAHRLDPHVPKLWHDAILAESLKIVTQKYLEEEKKKEESKGDAFTGRHLCRVCEAFKEEFGVCCTVCLRWAHITCDGSLDKHTLKDVPKNYICQRCAVIA